MPSNNLIRMYPLNHEHGAALAGRFEGQVFDYFQIFDGARPRLGAFESDFACDGRLEIRPHSTAFVNACLKIRISCRPVDGDLLPFLSRRVSTYL
jgi:hypothetical protein